VLLETQNSVTTKTPVSDAKLLSVPNTFLFCIIIDLALRGPWWHHAHARRGVLLTIKLREIKLPLLTQTRPYLAQIHLFGMLTDIALGRPWWHHAHARRGVLLQNKTLLNKTSVYDAKLRLSVHKHFSLFMC